VVEVVADEPGTEPQVGDVGSDQGRAESGYSEGPGAPIECNTRGSPD
jgi:hypothetical protein